MTYSILAMTATCETFGLVRPRMVEENVLIIQKGRHILYEMANDAYISNDTDMRHRINVEDESSSAVNETLEQGLVSAYPPTARTEVMDSSTKGPLTNSVL